VLIFNRLQQTRAAVVAEDASSEGAS
jgi:hypothetical protein